MVIDTQEQLIASRRISDELAGRIRSRTATAAEIAEYDLRDAAEITFMRAHAPCRAFAGKTCDELGLMP